jgi:hypothetical protein
MTKRYQTQEHPAFLTESRSLRSVSDRPEFVDLFTNEEGSISEWLVCGLVHLIIVTSADTEIVQQLKSRLSQSSEQPTTTPIVIELADIEDSIRLAARIEQIAIRLKDEKDQSSQEG